MNRNSTYKAMPLTPPGKPGTIDPCRPTLKKLAEQLACLDSLAAAGITIKTVPDEQRIYFRLPYEHTTAYFQFAEVLPYSPEGANGTVSDLCDVSVRCSHVALRLSPGHSLGAQQ